MEYLFYSFLMYLFFGLEPTLGYLKRRDKSQERERIEHLERELKATRELVEALHIDSDPLEKQFRDLERRD